MDSLSANHLLPVARLALMLDAQKRGTMHDRGEAYESVAAHTLMLVWITAIVVVEINVARKATGMPPLSGNLALLFAMVHDLPEALAGDTNTARALTAEQRDAKELQEAVALEEIRGMLSAHHNTEILARFAETYEEQVRPEARLVRYLDKVLPKLTHALNGGEALRRLGMNFAEVAQQHRQQETKLAAQYPEFADTVGVLLQQACLLAEDAMPGGEEP